MIAANLLFDHSNSHNDYITTFWRNFSEVPYSVPLKVTNNSCSDNKNKNIFL